MYNNPRNQWQNQDQAPQGSEFLDHDDFFERQGVMPNSVLDEKTEAHEVANIEEPIIDGEVAAPELPTDSSEFSDNGSVPVGEEVEFSSSKEFTAGDRKKIEKIIDKSLAEDPAAFYDNVRDINLKYLSKKFDRKIGEQK